MKKLKKVVSIFLASIFVLGISGCGNTANTAKGELNLFIWTEYIPDSVLKDFEKETGIKVNISTYSSNEDMLSKVKSEAVGTYDIVVPSDYMVDLMAKQSLLEELNKTNIPNISNISEDYLNAIKVTNSLFLI
jgi:spermidine/putrescine transport system substrate-binding protein/spermidine/putrescine transport system permease protein